MELLPTLHTYNSSHFLEFLLGQFLSPEVAHFALLHPFGMLVCVQQLLGIGIPGLEVCRELVTFTSYSPRLCNHLVAELLRFFNSFTFAIIPLTVDLGISGKEEISGAGVLQCMM